MPTTTEPPRPGLRRVPRLAIAGIIVAVLLIGGAMALLLTGHAADGPPLGGAAVGGPFALVDGDGQTVTDRTFHGKFMLVYFGYTFCPDVCPTTLNDVADAMDKLGAAAARVQPLFITIDPRRDTRAVVKQYAASFGSRLIGLTGSAQEIEKVAKEYRVYYAEHRTGPGPDDYSMDHSSILYLMGPDGQFVTPIPADESAAQIADAIRRAIS